MTYLELVEILDSMADRSLVEFQKKIISDTQLPMRCVRLPQLRKLAKSVSRDNWQELMAGSSFSTYEEVLVLGLALAYSKGSFAQKIPWLDRLIPHLDSWGLTDSIVPTLQIQASDREVAWAYALKCLDGAGEHTVRFGIILLMDNFLTPDRINNTAQLISQIQDNRYYVRMAAAWCLAEIAVKSPQLVEGILESGCLDPVIHNMTIRKMRESFRICPEQKARIKSLKRKES